MGVGAGLYELRYFQGVGFQRLRAVSQPFVAFDAPLGTVAVEDAPDRPGDTDGTPLVTAPLTMTPEHASSDQAFIVDVALQAAVVCPEI